MKNSIFTLVAVLFVFISYSQNTEKDCQSAKNKYLQQNPDVANARIDAWVHYVEFGKKEGRKWPDCDELSQKNDNLKFEDFYNKFITTNSTNSVYKGTRYAYPSNPPESFYKKDYYNGKLIYDGYVKKVVTSTSGNPVYKTEIKHGLGKEYFTNSNGYLEGYFSDNKLSGYGVHISDGYSYKGLFFMGLIGREGIKVNDGLNGTTKYIYEGKFFMEKYHGTGTLIYDFMAFVGEFNDGRMSAGIAYYPNGVKYIGGFANEKYHGYGSYYWGSGNVYKGDFKDGKFHGKGELKYSNGTIQSGIFENGNYVGEEKKQIVENNFENTSQNATIVKPAITKENQGCETTILEYEKFAKEFIKYSNSAKAGTVKFNINEYVKWENEIRKQNDNVMKCVTDSNRLRVLKTMEKVLVAVQSTYGNSTSSSTSSSTASNNSGTNNSKQSKSHTYKVIISWNNPVATNSHQAPSAQNGTVEYFSERSGSFQVKPICPICSKKQYNTISGFAAGKDSKIVTINCN